MKRQESARNPPLHIVRERVSLSAFNRFYFSPGSTSKTISIASLQYGTNAFSPVRLKSSSMNSSLTSQKYSWPGNEQNHVIQVKEDVGVDEADDIAFYIVKDR